MKRPIRTRRGVLFSLQAAEILVRAVGRGFIPGISPAESAPALAAEVCFCGLSFRIQDFFSKLFSR
jgi:hypothetical protein